jgi:hypothetical protein
MRWLAIAAGFPCLPRIVHLCAGMGQRWAYGALVRPGIPTCQESLQIVSILQLALSDLLAVKLHLSLCSMTYSWNLSSGDRKAWLLQRRRYTENDVVLAMASRKKSSHDVPVTSVLFLKDFNVKIRALLGSLGTALALCLSAPAWAGYTLSLSASPTSGVAGVDQTVVNVNLALDAGENVNTIGFSLGYDPAVLQYQAGSGVAGALLNDPLLLWFDTIAEAPAGQINFAFLELLGVGLDGFASGSIARLTFDLIGAGSSSLTLDSDLLEGFDLSGNPSYGLVASAPATGLTIDVTSPANQTPAPASLLLVGLGLALLGWTRRNAAARKAV